MTPVASHIVLVGPAYPYRGGIAHFLEAMGQGLVRRGHRVEAVTFSRQYPAFLFPGRTQYETAPPDAYLPATRLIDMLNPLSWKAAARQIGAQGAQVVIFQYWMPFFALAFGRMARTLRQQGIQVLAVVHNALPHERHPGDRRLGRYFLRACNGLLVLSDKVAADVQSLKVGVPVCQVAHPVYNIFGAPQPRTEARARLGLPEDAPVLLFFGFIRRYKGLQVLLEALPRVRQTLPNVQLLVAGEFYEEEAPYRELVRQQDLEACVHMPGTYIPNEAVATYFSAADVVVQPYLSATQSGVVQIAWHFEQPVIVTRVGGLAEVVPDGEAGFVVPPGDPEALAEALVRYFQEHLRPRFVAGVQREKQLYSWDRLLEAAEDLMHRSEVGT